MPIFMFAAAGAMLIGGFEMLDSALRAKAKQDPLRRQRDTADILRSELDLENLRDQAQGRGLDPDQVVAGSLALQHEELSIDQVLRALTQGSN